MDEEKYGYFSAASINLPINLDQNWNCYFQCSINSKITAAYTYSQESTVKISCHLNKYNNLYKNDKLQGLQQFKYVQHGEKCQATNLLFSYSPHNTIILWELIHAHRLHKSTTINFTRNQHLIKLQHVKTRPTKLESYFKHLPNSSYAFYKINRN